MAADSRVTVVEHPLVSTKLTHLRSVKTGAKQFRELVKELAMLMAYEATRGFQLKETVVQTPVAEARTLELAARRWPSSRSCVPARDGPKASSS